MVSLKPPDDNRGSGYLIDFGVCRGGDLNRWKEIGYKKVIGIEYVEDAVKDAKENMKLNGIENVEFHSGDMAAMLTPDFFKAHGKPDVLITDPPRAGMHDKVVRQILMAEPETIVYVSCNPATQARDISLFDEKYKVVKVQPVDMFPQTHHVENVVLLTRKEGE